MITVSPRFRERFPGARIGTLCMDGVANCRAHAGLEQRKHQLEQELRSRYAGSSRPSLMATAPLDAYCAYFRRFDKTYHVLLQLESVAQKGRGIPSVNAAVEAMFMAELRNGLLTAGHDRDAVQGAVEAGVTTGDEQYIKMNGQSQQPAMGDMKISDSAGVISCVLYGPDQRTRITPETTRLLFTVYAPAGVDQARVTSHLGDIRDNVLTFSPGATTVELAVAE